MIFLQIFQFPNFINDKYYLYDDSCCNIVWNVFGGPSYVDLTKENPFVFEEFYAMVILVLITWFEMESNRLFNSDVTMYVTVYRRHNLNDFTDALLYIYNVPFLEHNHEPIELASKLCMRMYSSSCCGLQILIACVPVAAVLLSRFCILRNMYNLTSRTILFSDVELVFGYLVIILHRHNSFRYSCYSANVNYASGLTITTLVPI
jgi:hypothetical protein